jgi:hypothetical protein
MALLVLLASALVAGACGGKTLANDDPDARTLASQTVEIDGGGFEAGPTKFVCQDFVPGTYRWRATRVRGDDTCGPVEQDVVTTIGGGGSGEGWSCHHVAVPGTCRDGVECERGEGDVLVTKRTIIDTGGAAIDVLETVTYADRRTGKVLSTCSYDGTYTPL